MRVQVCEETVTCFQPSIMLPRGAEKACGKLKGLPTSNRRSKTMRSLAYYRRRQKPPSSTSCATSLPPPFLATVVRQNEIVSSHEVKSRANLSRPVVVAAQWVNQHEIMLYLILGTSLTYPSVQPAISPPIERTIRSSRSSLPLPFSSQATRRS